MTSTGMRWMLAVTLLAAGCAAQGQSGQEPLPSLPAAPAPKPLVLPKTSGPIPLYASRPGDVPPPAPLPVDEETFCTTPSDTFYRTDKPLTVEAARAGELYLRAVMQQIQQNWKIPREANDPWLKGAEVRIRFEIQPDGSLNDPTIMMSSGRASYDRRALESVKRAAPFAAPPHLLSTPFKMCFRFSYNMDRERRDPLPVDPFAKKPAQP